MLGAYLFGSFFLSEWTQADEPWPVAEPIIEFAMSSILPAGGSSAAKRVYRLRFSPDHKKLAIRDGDNNIWQYDLATNQAGLLERADKDTRRIQDLAYSANGQYLYAIADRGAPSWFCWTTEDLKLVGTSNSVEGRVVERTLDGELMVNGRDVLNLSHPHAEPRIRKRSGLLRSNEGSVTLLVYNLSAVAGESGLEWRERIDEDAVVLKTPVLNEHWQRVLQQQVSRAVGRQTSVGGSLLLSPCGNRVVMLDRRGLLIWDAASKDQWRALSDDRPEPDHLPVNADILTAKFSPNGQWLAIGTVGKNSPEPINGEIHLIDMVAGRWLGRVATTTQSVSAIDFSDDQNWLAVGSTSLVDDRIRVYDLNAWMLAQLGVNQDDSAPVSIDGLLTLDPRVANLHALSLLQNANSVQRELTATLTFDASRAKQLMGQVIERMDSPVFEVRSQAEIEMNRLATQFPNAIRELQDDETLSSESQFRIRRTVATMSGIPRLSEAQWQMLCRSLHVLEHIAQPWAEELLVNSTKHPIRFVARQARLSHQVWLSRHSRR